MAGLRCRAHSSTLHSPRRCVTIAGVPLQGAGMYRTTLLLLVAAAPGLAAEPWVDPKLPVKDGLQLWLDATRPGAAKVNDGPIGHWMDGSGKGRHLTQSDPKAR